MELTHDFTVPAPLDETWATFMDLRGVGSCFPGAVVTGADAEGFSGTVKVKLGPIALQYAGAGTFLERDDAAHRAVIEAKGKDKRGNGTAAATVTIQLAPSGDGTRVDVTTDLSVTGKPAQFGRGVMQDVSDKLLQQFVACIEGRLAPEGGAPAAQPSAAPAVPDAAAAPEAAASPPTMRPGPRAVQGTPEPVDDSIDLGTTVLPVLFRRYAPYAAAALVGGLVGWLLGRRG